MLDQFTQLVRSARSRRRYVGSDPIPRELVLKLVDLARVVPSAINAQPLRYRVVTDRQQCEQVFLCTNWGRGDRRFGIGPDQRATAYIIILAVPDAPVDPAVDVGIAAQTIQLGASAAGYAACMVGDIDRPRLQKAIQLPEALKIPLLLGLGRPGEQVALEDLPAGSTTVFWRTPDGVHHVAKRKLEDVLV